MYWALKFFLFDNDTLLIRRVNVHLARQLHSSPDEDFKHMQRSELRAVVQKCGKSRDLSGGKKAHAFLINNGYGKNKFFLNLVIQMYGKCGSVQDAELAFRSIDQPNTFSWNNLITAYAQNGHFQEAINVYRRMNLEGAETDKFVLSSAMGACSSLGALTEGRIIHSRALAGGFIDNVMTAALITMYSSCGSLEEAKSTFLVENVGAFSWTAMITAYAQNGHPENAINLFWKFQSQGVKPDNVTFLSILDCCADLGQAEAIHRLIVQNNIDIDTKLGSALVGMYAKCGNLDKSWCIFQDVTIKNVVTWTTMVSAYAQGGYPERAFALLQEMDIEGTVPSGVTFVGILEGLSSRSSLVIGRKIHACIAESGYISDVMVANAVMNMYGRCGSCENAKMVFDEMNQRTLVSWSSMVAAYAQNGYPLYALEISRAMDLEGITKNQVVFINILSSCNHAGLLDDGLAYIFSMREDHGLMPTVEHYTCIIDSLGKVGRLQEAEDVITNVVEFPDVILWRALLGACKLHGDTQRGTRAVQHIDRMKTTRNLEVH